MRRRRAEKREQVLDSRYNNPIVGKFINSVMWDGKKYVAERLFYDMLEIVETKTKKTGLSVFSQAINNVKPSTEVRPRRIGGATYQVPREVSSSRKLTLAIRWIVKAAREKKGSSFAKRLAEEIILASEEKGSAYKHREDTRKMAQANRAFARFKW